MEKMAEVLDLMKNRVVAERIKSVFEHREKNSRLFQYWNPRVNCCGAIAYGLGVAEEMRKLTPEEYLIDFELANPADIFPGYVPTVAGLEFLRERCDEIKPPQIPKEGDIVVFWEPRGWNHSGIYLGSLEGKRWMYNKDGIDEEFSIADIDRYFRESGLDNRSFHRIKKNGSAVSENEIF